MNRVLDIDQFKDLGKGMSKSIVWEGTQFGYNPVSLLNRELCLKLIDAGYDLSIIAHGRPSFVPETNDRFHELSDRFNKKLEIPADIHVRHQRQPDFTSPDVGHWVIMQHWGFGSLPKVWVESMRQMVDEIWVRSSFVRECFIKSGVPDGKVFVIPTGVDTCKFQPGLNPFSLKTKKRFKFLSVGTALYRKAIEAYCATFTSTDDVCLVIKDMGGQSLHKGKITRKLISDIWKKDDAPEIEYADQLMDENNLGSLYNACDCLVHPYGSEGFLPPIFEAMACGLPVIAANEGPALDFCSKETAYLLLSRRLKLPQEAIDGKETVDFPWVIDPDHESLKQVLKHVFNHPEEAVKKGQAGRLKVEKNLTWEHAANRVMERLDSLCEKPILRFKNQRKSGDGPIEGLISIILPVDKDSAYLKTCIQNIRQRTTVPYEIVFVVNPSNEEKVRKNLKHKPNEKIDFQLVWCRENLGLAEAYNEGVKDSRGEYVVLLTPDAIVTQNWVSGLLECLRSVPEAGAVGALSNLRGIAEHSIKTMPVSSQRVQQLAENLRKNNRHRRISTNCTSTGCMLFTRNLFKTVGGFDEKFRFEAGYHEDFCLRAALEGKTNLIAGDVYVHQHQTNLPHRTKRYFKRKWENLDPETQFGEKILTLKAVEKGLEAYQKDNLDAAIKLLMKGIQRSPFDPLPYLELGAILLQSQNFKDALNVIKELPSGANELRKNEMLGYCSLGLNLDQDALRFAERAISIDPKSAPGYNLLGLIALRNSNREKAASFFQQSAAVDPGYGEPHANLGKIFLEKAPEKALDYIERSFILSPHIPDILSAYHSIITDLEQYQRAEPVFKSAVSAYPLNKILRYRFIDVLYRLGKLEETLKQVQESLVRFGSEEGMMAAALKIREMVGPKEIPKAKRNRKTALSICMITKNEEAFLPDCLHSVTPIADEIILVDTGSTDQTKDIATIFGARVYDFKWNDDFSNARNFSLSKANGDWIFVFDADEVLSPLDHEHLLKLILKSTGRPRAYSFITRNYVETPNVAEWTGNEGQYLKEEKGHRVAPFPKNQALPQ